MNDVTSNIVVVEGNISLTMFISSGVTGTVNAFSNSTSEPLLDVYYFEQKI